MDDPEVIVLGGGVAGLVAARRLSEAGVGVLLVEARERLGGRIWTVLDPALVMPIELGAEFIHGRPPEVWRSVRTAGLIACEASDVFWHQWGDRLQRLAGPWEEVEPVLARLPKPGEADLSFERFLAERCRDLPEQARELAAEMVEGFDAAPLDRASARAFAEETRAAEEIDESRSFRLLGGYQDLVDWYRSGLAAETTGIRLGSPAEEIRWRRGAVEMTLRSPTGGMEEIHAARAVITLPLGVLRAPPGAPGAPRFLPELPGKRDAASRLEMGSVVKMVFRFSEPFWEEIQPPGAAPGEDLRRLGFLLSRDPFFPTWWTAQPVQAPLLTAWAGGPAAARLSPMSEGQKVRQAMETLGRLLDVPPAAIESRLEAWHAHDWQSDPFSRGAYSYVPVGGLDARRALSTPVEETLYFAGEATHFEGQPGTVAGAIATGLRAAEEVLPSRGRIGS